MVVRNPYERLISEFYCKWGGIGALQNIASLRKFNIYIKQRINNRSLSGHHYTEQYKYIDNTIPIHILKFENLENGFNKLMKKYSLNITLNKHSNSATTKKFTVKSFSPKLIQLINKIYHKDFILFGYKKIIL